MRTREIAITVAQGLIIVTFVMIQPVVHASDLTSASFIIRDPIVGSGGGYQSSATYKLYGSGDLSNTGIGSSTAFIVRFGFLYYPIVTSGVLAAVATGSNADLSWNASTAANGFTVSSYKIGKSQTIGGPYTYTTLGNVTAFTYTNLAPGTYYFSLQTIDALGNIIATSNEATLTMAPALTFGVSDSNIAFGTVVPVSARYATNTGGSASNSVAHTLSASGNGASGYTITYYGATLQSGPNSITPATITSDADGVPGTAQFALSVSTNGSATIPSAYQQSSLNWSYVSNTTTTVASTTVPTATETFDFRYLTNTSNAIPTGQYGTAITYVLTGNF